MIKFKTQKTIIYTDGQAQMWRREYKYCVKPRTKDFLTQARKQVEKGLRPIIEVSELDIEILNKLSTWEKNSWICYLSTDEIYSLKLNFKILNMKSCKTVIRPYQLSRIKFLRIIIAPIVGFAEFTQDPSAGGLIEILKWSKKGIGMAIRKQILILIEKWRKKESVSILLGYTDVFATSFISIENMDTQLNESLVSKGLQNIKIDGNREYTYSFLGQRGQINRAWALKTLSRIPNSYLKVRDSFGGYFGEGSGSLEAGIENVEILKKSRFSVCPPGNISGNSFRITESSICGALPIMTTLTLCDPTFNIPTGFWRTGWCLWKANLKSASMLGDDTININQRKNLQFIHDKIKIDTIKINEIVYFNQGMNG
jgi:hypothetical protein